MPKLFSGDMDLAKPRLIFSRENSDLGSRAEEGSGEESARASGFLKIGGITQAHLFPLVCLDCNFVLAPNQSEQHSQLDLFPH